MANYLGPPYVLKGGLVLIDPYSPSVPPRVIKFQYNPSTLSRTLQIKGVSGEGGQRSEALRLTGPPVETIKLDAEFDASGSDQLAKPLSAQQGIQPQLAALETIVYPASSQLIKNNILAQAGTIEIAPMETSLTLFIWNMYCILPVRLTDFTITEEAFTVNLIPIRAKVSLGMRVLNIDDLGFDHKGGSLYMSYQQNKEMLARMLVNGNLNELGINAIP